MLRASLFVAALLFTFAFPCVAEATGDCEPEVEERVAVLVHATSGAAAILEAAACHFTEVMVPTPTEVTWIHENVERARAGKPPSRKLFGIARLLTVTLTAEGEKRTLHVASMNMEGVTDLRTEEATEATVPEAFRRVLEDLPRRRTTAERWWRVRKPGEEEAAFFHASVFGGRKQLDEDEWGPLTPQNEFALNLTGGGAAWPVHVAADWYTSLGSHEPTDTTATLMEFGLGARRILDIGRVRPSVGAGVAVSTIRIVQDPDPRRPDAITGRGFGPWVDAGVSVRFLTWWDLGVKVRWSQAEVDAESRGKLPAGGFHYGLVLGTGS